MRLVHLADLHLGYRQYQRLTPGGLNQREADVARSFQRAIDAVIALAPDVVLFAGDIFHTVRPANPAILHAFIQFARLREALPKAEIVMIAGNHDLPRTAEAGCILQLFARLGLHVADREAQRFSFPDLDLSVLAVPDVQPRPDLSPDDQFAHNVLLLHGEIQGMIPEAIANIDRAALELTREELGAHRWSYVALGHYHVYREIAPNAFYAGSIDYTSVNIWGEKEEGDVLGLGGKGFIEWDFDRRAQTFHALPPSRAVISLKPVNARGLTAPEVNDAIRQAVERCDGGRGVDDKIVRLRVNDLQRHIARELDHRLLRDLKRRALHFHLDARRPEVMRRNATSGAPRRRLHELVRDHLSQRVIDADLDRAELIALGLEYLDQAERVAVPATNTTAGGEE